MRKLTVEAFEDRSRPGGGHAVILVRGLCDVPSDLTFRLRPADGSTALDRPGTWPDGERRPLSTRMTPEGAELLVGPEIVESPELLPGTLAILDIPRCGVRGEFLWPSIQPIARPKRRHVVAKPVRVGADAAGLAAEPIAFEEAPDASSAIAPDVTGSDSDTAKAWADHAERIAAAETREKVAAEIKAEGEIAGPIGLTISAPSVVPAPAAGGVGLGNARAKTTTVAVALKKAPSRPARAALLAIAFAAGALASSLVPWHGPLNVDRTAIATQAKPPSEASRLLALVEPGAVSPAGHDASAATPARLLERADALLNGPAASRDGKEARFMIRRALGQMLGQERGLWALTQLGSLDAEPDAGREPDYAQAAAVWELASALGDPIAMCFRAALDEHGLGRPRDTAAAVMLYRRAKAAGGCPGLDDTLARLGAQ